MRILSLSGGGIRGLFQAVFLREIASRLDQPLHTYFDLIAGTSTGSIIALGVALGIDLDRVVQLFEQHGKEIFPEAVRRSAQPIYSYFCKGPIYQKEPLRKALNNAFVTRDGKSAQLKDCLTPVVIPATTLDRYQIRSFTTLDRCGARDGPDRELFATDVALASSAAPLFFPAHKPQGRASSGEVRVEERTYSDGGLWANNPVLHAVMTAKRCYGTSFEEMRVISVGNGEIPSGSVALDFDKLRRGLMIKPLLDMMFATQSELADETVGVLLGDEQFSGKRMLRVNTRLAKPIELDDFLMARQHLKPLAENEARSNIGKIKSLIS
jgi:patatin-like phospholipase/acyl hydrolase